MADTFKVLSALLTYPTAELQAAGPELKAALAREALLPAPRAHLLNALIDDIASHDLYDAQERYILLFDRTRSLSLHLFEHVHGEGRDRGQAMVDLAQLYDKHGVAISARELPDYLPLFLEFLSILPLEEARDLLTQPLHIVAALGERLRRRESVYAAAFGAVEALARAAPKREELDPLLAMPQDDPNDLAALDKAWEDEPVTFGPGPGGAADCGGGIRDMLKRMGADLGPRSASSGTAGRPAKGGRENHG